MLKALAAGLILLGASVAFGQSPDPRDSVILESKTVNPLAGACGSAGLKVKVWVTNKDSLANISLPLLTNTLSGGAYATLSRRNTNCARTAVSDVFDFLYPPGPGGIQRLSSRVGGGGSGYNSVPRDSFIEAFTLSNPSDDAEKFPVNLTRALLGELKFDTVLSNFGQFVIDSSRILAITIQFVNLAGNGVFVNFVKSVITVDSIPVPPHPADSIIVESKYYFPTAGPCASSRLHVKVWITNKDTLGGIVTVFLENTLSGGAYATLSRSGSCSRTLLNHTFNFLYPPGPGGGQRLPTRTGSYSPYNSVPRDSFLYGFVITDPASNDDKMPPNPTRTLLGEMKFDTVLSNLGQFEIDSSRIVANRTLFFDIIGNEIKVNFVKSIITVIPKGDLNADGMLTSADMVLMLNCAFCVSCPDPLSGRYLCDMNCDGLPTSADVVLELNAIFLGTPFPC